MTEIPTFVVAEEPSAHPAHAAVLTLIEIYTRHAGPVISERDIAGMTSYLIGWGPEGHRFSTGSNHSYGISSILIDLDSAGLVDFDYHHGGYFPTGAGLRWLTNRYFTVVYHSDIYNLIHWYTEMFKGPELKLRKDAV